MTSPELRATTFGPYIVEQQIGVGGMGVVYRARHSSTLQTVALKSVRLRSPELLASFRREVHALAMVQHPGIVRIIEHGVTGNTPWYAMELIAGQSLAQHLDRLRNETSFVARTAPASARWHSPSSIEARSEGSEPPSSRVSPNFSLRACVGAARAICRALSFLHGHGLVHRDLKPENILLKVDGSPILVDFGLVVQFGGTAGREVLELADLAGTFAYMAPEQRFGRFVDARADLYSLGCVLYEWLTGEPPFGDTGIWTGSDQVPPPPSAYNPQVGVDLDALVARLIAEDPQDRLGYADDVEAALAGIDGEETQAQKPRSVYLYRSPLAGRGDVLPRLEEVLVGAVNGQSKVVLVTGESGGGKTRLIMELAARAADRGMSVVTGECPPIAAGVDGSGGLGAPLQPFAQFLHTVVDACRAGGSAVTRRLLGGRAAVLAPYEPSLAELVSEADSVPLAVLPSAAALARLFACLGALIVDYARERPLLLVLDDLQWADELSQEFLLWLADTKPAGGAPYAVVGTCRIEEMGSRLRLLTTKREVIVEGLPRFDRTAVRAMVSGMLALRDPPRSLVDFVDQESRGNPFFIAEYLRAAIEAGLLRRDRAGSWLLSSIVEESAALRQKVTAPPTIAALVGLRLRDLDRASVDILQAAAVLGREFDVELVARTADLDPAAVLDAYAALRPRNILEEDSSGVSRFAHDKLREIAYAEAEEGRRAELHRRAATALEERYSTLEVPPHLGELGYHYAKGGVCERAAHYYERAGQYAGNAYANEDAIRFLRLALEQLEADPSQAVTIDAARTRLQEQIGDGLLVVGRPADAREMFEAGLASMGARLERHERARWRRKLAQTWERQHRHIDALLAYSSAEVDLGDAPGALESAEPWWHEFVQVQVDKAWSLYFLARVEELTALVERVRPAVLERASPAQLEKFLECQVMGSLKRERLRITDETLEHSRVLLEAGERCGEARGVANARFIRGFVLLMRGYDEDAEPFFVNAIEAARRLDDALLRTRFLSYYLILHRRLGRLTEARAAAESLLTYAEERGMFDYVGVAQAILSWCAWRVGREDDTERCALAALSAWDKLRPAYIYPLQWLARMPLGACLQKTERIPEALEHWRAMLQDPQQLLPPALHAAIELALSRGDAPSSAAVVEEATRLRYL